MAKQNSNIGWVAALVASAALAACGDQPSNTPSAPAGPAVIVATAGPDAFQGDDGVDTVSYADAPEAIYLVFGDLTHSTGWAAGDTFVSIENVIGTNFSDVIGFGDGDNTIDGGPGNDVLIGGLGNDILIGGLGEDAFQFPGPGFGHDTIQGFDLGDRIDFTSYAGLTFSRLTISASATGVLVSVGDDSITITGVTPDQVTADRFAFAR